MQGSKTPCHKQAKTPNHADPTRAPKIDKPIGGEGPLETRGGHMSRMGQVTWVLEIPRSETFLNIFLIHVKICTSTYFSANLPLSSTLS